MNIESQQQNSFEIASSAGNQAVGFLSWEKYMTPKESIKAINKRKAKRVNIEWIDYNRKNDLFSYAGESIARNKFWNEKDLQNWKIEIDTDIFYENLLTASWLEKDWVAYDKENNLFSYAGESIARNKFWNGKDLQNWKIEIDTDIFYENLLTASWLEKDWVAYDKENNLFSYAGESIVRNKIWNEKDLQNWKIEIDTDIFYENLLTASWLKEHWVAYNKENNLFSYAGESIVRNKIWNEKDLQNWKIEIDTDIFYENLLTASWLEKDWVAYNKENNRFSYTGEFVKGASIKREEIKNEEDLQKFKTYCDTNQIVPVVDLWDSEDDAIAALKTALEKLKSNK